MASASTRNEEKKGSRPPQATTSLGACSKVSLSRSEEFLTRISTELTNEALFVAGYHENPMPNKEKQTQDQGTQISRHGVPWSLCFLPSHSSVYGDSHFSDQRSTSMFFTENQGPDTRSNRNCIHTKTYLLPSPRDKSHMIPRDFSFILKKGHGSLQIFELLLDLWGIVGGSAA